MTEPDPTLEGIRRRLDDLAERRMERWLTAAEEAEYAELSEAEANALLQRVRGG